MIWIFGHPSFERLSRYADGELEGPRRDRIASHLAGCTRCQGTLRFIRELGVVARQLQSPEPPQDAVARFLARRAAGDRVILPTADPVPIEPERRRIAPVVAAGIGMVVFGTLLVSVARLQADRSRLDFAPNRPTAGETIDVRYVPGAMLRSEPTLVLRARYRYASGADEIVDVARLDRVIGGEFRGGFTLPDSVVYAVFAVEDTAASRVDHNNRRLWELIVHDERGRPLMAALRERYNEHSRRDLDRAYESVAAMTDLYPGRVEGWYRRYALEPVDLRADRGARTVEFHRQRLAELVPTVPSHADANELASLALYALVLGDESAPLWRKRLLESAPAHPAAVSFRLAAAPVRNGSPAVVLDTVEAIWNARPTDMRALLNTAFRSAVASNDLESVLRWAQRVIERYPDVADDFLAAYLPLVRDLGRPLELADSMSTWIIRAGHHHRALYRTAEQGRRWSLRQVAVVRGTLGAALVHRQRLHDGLRLLDEALSDVWRRDWFRIAGAAALEIGDTATAIPYLAAFAADPLTTNEAARALLEPLATDRGGAEQARQWIDLARADLRRRLLADATLRPIDSDAFVETLAGDERALTELLAGNHTVVAFWSRRSQPSLSELPELQALAPRLSEFGASVIAITSDSTIAEIAEVARSVIPTVPVFVDAHGDAVRAFGHVSYPQYFVVDRDANIRFEFTTLDDAVRQVYALLNFRDANVLVE